MKRYGYNQIDGCIVEHPDGEIARYEEAAAIERQRDRAVELLKEFDRLDDVVVAMDWDLRRADLLAEIEKEKK